MNKKTLVLGASENPERYSHKAILKLTQFGHSVEAVGNKTGQVNSIKIQTGQPDLQGIHTVTLYLGPANQSGIIDYVLKLKPQRLIFNPGTENPDFERKAVAQGIETVEGCTLVMLSTNQF